MKKLKQSIVYSCLMFSLLSCDESPFVQKTGTIRLLATDAPFNFDTVTSARITVSKIVLRKNGEKVTVMEKETTLDLLQLRNGIVESLSQLEIPVGEYNEVILVISEASVDLKDGRSFPLTVPSGASSGLKVFVKPAITVSENVSSSLLLDFDLSQSFVPQGTNSGITGFNFNPVIRATNMGLAGSISGIIWSNNNTPVDLTDDVPVPGAVVTIKNGSEIVTTAVTDDMGFYKVLGLPALDYTVVGNFGGRQRNQFCTSTLNKKRAGNGPFFMEQIHQMEAVFCQRNN